MQAETTLNVVAVTKLKGLFPKWDPTPEQWQEWDDNLAGWPVDEVLAVLPLHWRKRGSFTTPVLEDLLSMLWARRKDAERKNGGTRQQADDPFLEAVRRSLVLGDGTHPYEIWIRFYRREWCGPAQQRESYAGTIRHRCLNALVAAGMITDDGDASFATRAADVVFLDPFCFDEGLREVLLLAPRVGQETPVAA